MAKRNDLTWFEGEDIALNFTISPVVDISGWHLQLTIKNKLSDTAVLLQKANDTIDGPNGKFSFLLTRAQTQFLGVGRFEYDAWRTDAGAEAAVSIGRINATRPVRT